MRKDKYNGLFTNSPLTNSTNKMIETVSKNRHMIIPRSNKEKQELVIYNEIFQTLQRKVIPYPISSNTIKAFSRYKGMLLAISHKPFYSQQRYILFSLVKNPTQIHIEITRRINPDNPTQVNYFEEEFLDFFEVKVDSPKDMELSKKVLDGFFQRGFEEIAYDMKEGDGLIINRSGAFFTYDNFDNVETLQKATDLLFSVSENLKNY